MARRQAKRKRTSKKAAPRKAQIQFPWARMAMGAIALAFVVTVFQISTMMLDRPITAVDIEAPMKRVTSMQIQAAISEEVRSGFISADLKQIRRELEALDWVDVAVVRRRWPDRLQILVAEQIPAARWQDDGLLNTRGELFVTGARHIPAELPRLSGPEGSSDEVARRYLAMRGPLIEAGMQLKSVRMTPRGAWELILSNGVQVRLGRRDIEQRSHRFLSTVTRLVTHREGDIDFVDMRYSNGFSIGWKSGVLPNKNESDPQSRPVLAAERGEG